MEFDMALAVPRGRPEQSREEAYGREKDEIRQILVDYGVPLVQCDHCTVNGDLPSHGPYAEAQTRRVDRAGGCQGSRAKNMAELKKIVRRKEKRATPN